MKCLIIEDTKARIDFFKEKLAGHDVTYFEHVTDAIAWISANSDVQLVFLDHDLEQLHGVPSDMPSTGYSFVQFVVDNNLAHTATFIVHSMNPVGAEAMYQTLKQHDYFVEKIPFNLLLENK